MIADIVPVLAAICEMDADEVNIEFSEALDALSANNGGQVDTRVFVEAVMAFRQAHPFELEMLQAGQKAREDIDARAAGAT